MNNPELSWLSTLGALAFALLTAPLSGQEAEDHRARDIATIVEAWREAGQPVPGFGESFRIGLEEARVILELTARAFPKYPYALVVLGKVHRQTGNAEAACDAFAKALDADPADIVAKVFGARCGEKKADP